MQKNKFTQGVVASRVLTIRNASGATSVIIEIYYPYYGNGEWRCPFSVQAGDIVYYKEAYGEDSLQSLVLTFDYIKKILEENYPEARWMDFEPGNIGLPFVVHPGALPWYEFMKLQNQIENLVELKINNYVEQRRKGSPGNNMDNL